MKTTATMVIGFDETLDERLEHLERTRDFQDETGGLFSFLCWTYKPYGTAFGGREISAEEYRRHIHSGWNGGTGCGWWGSYFGELLAQQRILECSAGVHRGDF